LASWPICAESKLRQVARCAPLYGCVCVCVCVCVQGAPLYTEGPTPTRSPTNTSAPHALTDKYILAPDSHLYPIPRTAWHKTCYDSRSSEEERRRRERRREKTCYESRSSEEAPKKKREKKREDLLRQQKLPHTTYGRTVENMMTPEAAPYHVTAAASASTNSSKPLPQAGPVPGWIIYKERSHSIRIPINNYTTRPGRRAGRSGWPARPA